jgi:N-acetylneuraminate synthase/N,N'-diacetyllegionaminate synthase
MIEIDGKRIGDGERPYIIAEIGINAQNNLTLAKRFIEVAAKSGADAVKFQTHIVDAEMVESEMRSIGAGDVYDTVSGCEWTVNEHQELQSHANKHNVSFLSTPFSTEAVDILEEIDVPAIKIGSGEMNNRHLAEYAANTGKPLLVSTGMNTFEQIKTTCEFLNEVASEYALFYCVSAYPTAAEDFDFETISSLKEISNVPVGFSDHSEGVEAAKVAIGNGAAIIEKHFTIDRRLPGPDQEVSIEPEQLTDLCDFSRLYSETSSRKASLHEQEIEIKEWAQHSIVAKRSIGQGEILSEANITSKRPRTGVSANKYREVLGKQTVEALSAGTTIKWEHLKDSNEGQQGGM